MRKDNEDSPLMIFFKSLLQNTLSQKYADILIYHLSQHLNECPVKLFSNGESSRVYEALVVVMGSNDEEALTIIDHMLVEHLWSTMAINVPEDSLLSLIRSGDYEALNSIANEYCSKLRKTMNSNGME